MTLSANCSRGGITTPAGVMAYRQVTGDNVPNDHPWGGASRHRRVFAEILLKQTHRYCVVVLQMVYIPLTLHPRLITSDIEEKLDVHKEPAIILIIFLQS